MYRRTFCKTTLAAADARARQSGMTPAGIILQAVMVGALLPAMGACNGQDDESAHELDASLRFSISEGQSDNHFIQQNGISAHLNLRTYPTPRLIVAFPAGNSGAALFFHKVVDGPTWGSVTDMQTIERTDERGRTVYGMQADIDIQAETISLEEADVGSIRFLRKAVDYSRLPPRKMPDVRIDGNRVHFSRERPDGQSGYVMDVEVLAGDLQTEDGLKFVAEGGGTLKIRVAATSGDPLEATVSADRLITAGPGNNEALGKALAFLTYEQKMLAGSWRFLTYFGRDTLLSIRLLMPILTADTAEIGLGSVLERINHRGEVAHEEEIGELAVYRNMAEHERATAEPIYDYDMVDDNLLLAPVFSTYIETFGPERAEGFLSRHTSAAETLKSQLVRNLRLVAKQAEAFANEPDRSNLVSIKDGLNDGNWRDSEEGLVGGRYPYDVNAVLMPAALHAAAEIVGNGSLDDYAESLPEQEELLRMAAVWEANAARYFKVSVAAEQVRERLVAYARENGYPLVDIPEKDVSFYAVALDKRFEPIPVMHSDTAMDLLFLQSPERHIKEIVSNLTRPFPAGLATPIGVLAANPAYADAEAQVLVTRNHYHGTVVWSWQQAMMIAGLDNQLRRDDLSESLREELRTARQKIWQGILASKKIINSELWSFAVRGDEFVIAPFGQSEGHLTESNTVQLWSTVFLALNPGTATP